MELLNWLFKQSSQKYNLLESSNRNLVLRELLEQSTMQSILHSQIPITFLGNLQSKSLKLLSDH